MAEHHEVEIFKVTGHSDLCFPRRSFRAAPGDAVSFLFAGQTDADITFTGNSPFNPSTFKADGTPQTVVDGARSGSYGYTVKWDTQGSGVGNGGGEVHGTGR